MGNKQHGEREGITVKLTAGRTESTAARRRRFARRRAVDPGVTVSVASEHGGFENGAGSSRGARGASAPICSGRARGETLPRPKWGRGGGCCSVA